MTHVKRTVTYEVKQFDVDPDEEVAELLEPTGWSMGGSFGQYLFDDKDLIKARLFRGDYVIVSSKDEVSWSRQEEFEEEFEKQ